MMMVVLQLFRRRVAPRVGACRRNARAISSYVLYGGGYGQTLLQDQAPASTSLEGIGDPGPGRWVTIYANADHAYIEVVGVYLDTAAGQGKPPRPPDTGPRWTPSGTGPSGFIARHPPGL